MKSKKFQEDDEKKDSQVISNINVIVKEQRLKNIELKYKKYKSLFDITVSNDTVIFKPKIQSIYILKNKIKKILDILNVEKNICYNKTSYCNKDNILYILKSNCSVSSIIEIRELVEVHHKLEQFDNILKIETISNEIVVKFKQINIYVEF